MASGFPQETNSNCCDGGVNRISSLPDKAISKILVCLPIKELFLTFCRGISLDMASRFQEETNSNCCVDRISSLPDKAISNILVCLPIKEAVRTSKLSRTWRYTWMSIPELVFDQHACAGREMVNFINSVLLLHDGDITKFEVRDLLDHTYLDRWLLLLSRKKLTKLCIKLVKPNPYVCHTCLFCCQALSSLKLKFCLLQLPPRSQFDGFKNLTVLHLEEVNASKETIEFLVNTSPLLENLSVTQWNSVISNLNISAPNLRRCVIHGNFRFIITFVRTPELRDTDISLGMYNRLDGIVGGLIKIQKAAFSHPTIRPQVVPNNFTCLHLNHLRLKLNFEDPDQVFAALWLSKSSPALRIIYIQIGVGRFLRRVARRNMDAIPKLQEMYDLLGESKDVLQSLETCDLEGFEGSINELRFIQFFLLHASVLQTMNIGWRMDDTSRLRRDGALVELAQFQRASLGVKIKLYDLK